MTYSGLYIVFRKQKLHYIYQKVQLKHKTTYVGYIKGKGNLLYRSKRNYSKRIHSTALTRIRDDSISDI